MIEKTILILAKSFKHGAFCIAGRELIKKGGFYEISGWIRPVSKNGAITAMNCLYENNHQAKLLDVVNLAFIEHQPIAGQPENFLIDNNFRWKNVKNEYTIKLQDFVESPNSLWLRERHNSDSVTAESIAKRPIRQSLYFIKPNDLSLKMYWLHSQRRKRVKASFLYNDCQYELQITDSQVWEYLKAQFPREDEPDKKIKLPNGDEYYLCVSLGGEWEEKRRHYKLVASIIGTNGQMVK